VVELLKLADQVKDLKKAQLEARLAEKKAGLTEIAKQYELKLSIIEEGKNVQALAEEIEG